MEPCYVNLKLYLTLRISYENNKHWEVILTWKNIKFATI